MAAPMVGSISEFVPGKEDWESYQKRLEIWMKANRYGAEDRATVFLATVGPIAFELLISLFTPIDIADVAYEDMTNELKRYYKPVRNVIWERQQLTERKQRSDEPIQEYILELKRMSRYCNFGHTLEERLRDCLVQGVRNETVQRRLFTEKELSWRKACDIAVAMEVANRDIRCFNQSSASQTQTNGRVNRIKQHAKQKPNSKEGKPCYRCNLTNHTADNCFYKSKTCNKCKKVGHIARACKSTGATPQGKQHWKSKGKAHYVDQDNYEQNEEEAEGMYAIYSMDSKKMSEGIKVPLIIEGTETNFFLDTAASHSVIGEDMYRKFFDQVQVVPTKVKLLDYSDNVIPLLGEAKFTVIYEKKEYSLPLVIAKGRKAPLFGRNWMAVVNIDWGRLCAVTDQRKPLREQLRNKYRSVFEGKGVIKTFTADIKIKEDVNPKFCKARPVPYSMREAVETELNRLEKEGIIKKVEKSDWATPIVVVPKANKQVRLCGDYKVTINPVLEDIIYPLPTAEDLFAQMGGARVFTKLDLTSAYLQLELTEKSKPLLVINSHKGLYEFQRLSFGIATAPSIFQSVMDQVLQGIPHAECLLDDILIGTSTEEEHEPALHDVLKRLDAYGIRVNLDKCKFKVNSVEYLGHRIDGDGIHPLQDKVKAITEAPPPQNLTELRAFLGMINYYGKFMGNMSTVLAPLYSLLKANSPWIWNEEQEAAFQECKTMLSSESVLVHYDMKKPLILACDASGYGLGCVLSHQMEDGSERPIAYASRTLSTSERNYAQIEKEALSIIYGVKKFHKYIYGRKFLLHTDHKPLTTLFGPKTGIPTLAAARLQRWALILMAHDYDIRYRKSEDHANADGLSRLPGKEDPETIEAQINYFTNVNSLPISSSDVAKATRKDPVLSRALDYTLRGWPNYVTDEGLLPFFKRKDELSVDQDCLLWGMRVVIPPTLQDYVLHELHAEHMGMVKMKARARSYLWYPGLDHDICHNRDISDR